jgi:hypothetical protein
VADNTGLLQPRLRHVQADNQHVIGRVTGLDDPLDQQFLRR